MTLQRCIVRLCKIAWCGFAKLHSTTLKTLQSAPSQREDTGNRDMKSVEYNAIILSFLRLPLLCFSRTTFLKSSRTFFALAPLVLARPVALFSPASSICLLFRIFQTSISPRYQQEHVFYHVRQYRITKSPDERKAEVKLMHETEQEL